MNEYICRSFPDDSIPIFKGYFYETIHTIAYKKLHTFLQKKINNIGVK